MKQIHRIWLPVAALTIGCGAVESEPDPEPEPPAGVDASGGRPPAPRSDAAAAVTSDGPPVFPPLGDVATTSAPPAQVAISEIMARNSTGILDEDKDRSDWIELRNVSNAEVALAGWTFAVGKARWVFPSVRLAAGMHLLVFASAKDRRDPAKPLHTNFKIDADGELIHLLRPDGAVESMVAAKVAVRAPDVSYAPTGASGPPVLFEPATPGAPNGPPLSDFVAPPAIAGPRGLLEAPMEVRLSSATAGATLRYTTDGSAPTATSGMAYASPIGIARTTVLRARAFKAGLASSSTVTATYLFPADVVKQVYPQPPTGWPVSRAVNNQAFRYGFQPAVRGAVTDQDLAEALRKLPSVSIATAQDNLTGARTGIYVNALLKGQEWEKPASIELLGAGEAGFQIDAGLRIRGGYSRNAQYIKHSFRLYFRKSHGPSSLKYPLNGASGTDTFRTLELRTEQNYHWGLDGGTQNTAVREVFTRDLMGAAGQLHTRSRYVHLYLNGQYWGLYETEEAAQEDHAASYFGGVADDYDTIKTSNHPDFFYEVSNGTVDAWRALWDRARAHAANPTTAGYFAISGRGPDGKAVAGQPVYLDVDNLITYMLLTYYTGDGDSPLSNFLTLNRANNWRCVRSRVANVGFRCFVRDGEHTLLAPSWVANRAIANTTGGTNRPNFMYSNPEWIHEDLARSPEHRVRVGDLAHRLLFNQGAMTPARAQALFDARAAQLEPAIVADALRWGTSPVNHTVAQWRARLDAIRRDFFPARPAQVVAHLRMRGFYPALEPPAFSRRGGKVAAGFALTLAAAQPGTIYYTLDGSDPRAVGGAPAGRTYGGTPIAINPPATVSVRLADGQGGWSALDEAKFEP